MPPWLERVTVHLDCAQSGCRANFVDAEHPDAAVQLPVWSSGMILASGANATVTLSSSMLHNCKQTIVRLLRIKAEAMERV